MIEKVKSKGFLAYVCSNRADDAGVPLADKFFNVSILDIDSLIDIVKKENIASVVTGASDLASLSVGKINRIFNFPGVNDYQVLQVTNKRNFIDLQKKLDLPHPITYFIEDDQKLNEIFANTLKLPMIMKPYFSSGSRGVRVVNSIDEISYYHKEVCDASSLTKGYLLQEFLTDAIEYGCECLVENGRLIFLKLTHKFLNHIKVPIGHYVPNDLNQTIVDRLKSDVQKIINYLEINNSPINIDVLVDKSGVPFIIDLSFRLGGNCLPQIMDLKYGINPFDKVINYSLNLQYSYNEIVNPENFGSIILGGSKNGVLTEELRKKIEECVQGYDKILEKIYDFPDGFHYPELTQGNLRFGHLIINSSSLVNFDKTIQNIYKFI